MSEVRQRLVEVGTALLETDGLARLSLRRIANAAGVSHGAPRHHFPAYENLLAAVARSGVEDLDALLCPCLSGSDGEAALRSAAHVYLDFAVARPEMFDLMSRHDVLDGAGGDLRELTGRWFGLVRLALQRQAGAGAAVDDNDALALWSGVHGVAALASRRTAEAVTHRPPQPGDVLDRLLDGLLPR